LSLWYAWSNQTGHGLRENLRLSVAKTGTGFAVAELIEKATARYPVQGSRRHIAHRTAGRPWFQTRGRELLDAQRCSIDGTERTEGDALQTQCGHSTAPVQGGPEAEDAATTHSRTTLTMS